jgi:hypothetical protein
MTSLKIMALPKFHAFHILFLQILALLCIGLANGFLLPSNVQLAFRPTRLAGSLTSRGTRFLCADTLACMNIRSNEGAVLCKDVCKIMHVNSWHPPQPTPIALSRARPFRTCQNNGADDDDGRCVFAMTARARREHWAYRGHAHLPDASTLLLRTY